MAKGPRKHLKRLAAPRDWRIPRTRYTWAARTRCGPHPMNSSLPLLALVRDMISPTYTAREAKRTLYDGKLLVDGMERHDHKFPVGIMDVIAIPTEGKFFRVLPLPRRPFTMHSIDKAEAAFKLCRIVKRTMVRRGDLQLNLHDGRNILLSKGKQGEGLSGLSTHDVLKIEVPSQKIVDSLKYGIGTFVLISDGKNVGLMGRVQEIHKPKGTSLTTDVTLKMDNGTIIEVPIDYTFAVGKEEPLISLERPKEEPTRKTETG